MIRKITFNNFYSFKEQQTLDFTVNKKKSADYYQTYDGKQITKIAAFVGGNASGKTNTMKLFGFINYFITTTQRDESPDKTDIGFKPYAFGGINVSSFTIEFETEKYLYTYKLEANLNEVVKEELNAKALKKKSKPIKVFLRDKQNTKINKKLITGVTSKKLKSIRKDVSVIAFIKANYDEGIINDVFNYFDSSKMNVNEEGMVIPVEIKLSLAAKMYSKNQKIKESMEEFIRNFGIGIDSFKINKKINEIIACHKISKKNYDLPITYESHGTKTLFVELLNILAFKDKSNLLVSDEIEAGLHPQAVDKIIQYISDSLKYEKKQFIFSSHSLNFLKKFDAQQIYLVEKKDNSSEVFRLDQLGVRPDDNFYAKYMTGAYGAFPKIRI